MKRLIQIVCLSAFLGLSSGWAVQTSENKPHRNGSETVPVHLIPLKDEFNQPIIPAESHPLPFSSRQTCAPCHDYNVINTGLHFSGTKPNPDGRPGEPWFWVEEKTGTVLPLSYQDWEGTWHPDEFGLNAWDMALLFGRHMTGGGILDPAEGNMDPSSRWNVSGNIEINCMGCHNASRRQSHSEWAKQILRENFRWAASASAGLGEVGGMASRLSSTWDVFDGPNPDDTEWAVVPSVKYSSGLFTSSHQIFFDIADKPADGRCLTCHSVTPVEVLKQDLDADVHSSAGLMCADCHRNGIEHEMTRGYEGEVSSSFKAEAHAFSCRGCHLEGGRLGAPFPKHRGLPAVHLKRLSCTTCHSVPWPDKDLNRVRTSRANRLGIFGVARWETDLPQITEPVYVRDKSGKISPHRMVWPSFWGEIAGEDVIPIKSDQILAEASRVFASEENLAQVLLALYREPELGGIPVLMFKGKMYTLNVDSGLDVENVPDVSDADEVVLAVKIEDSLLPLIPEFDPQVEMLDIDLETRIQIILEALATNESAPGQPVLLNQDALYAVQEGYLEKSENPGESRTSPRLCWLVDGQPEPLVEAFDMETVFATAGSEQTLTENQVKRGLEILQQKQNSEESDKQGSFGYFSGGLMFFLDKDGELAAQKHKSADPVVWPIGHRVRPAQQSLGVNGCRDCHRASSTFFFGKVKGNGPLVTEKVRISAQGSFMKLTLPYQRLFGLSFTVRPLLKVVLFITAFVCGSLLLIVFLLVLGRMSGLVEKRR